MTIDHTNGLDQSNQTSTPAHVKYALVLVVLALVMIATIVAVGQSSLGWLAALGASALALSSLPLMLMTWRRHNWARNVLSIVVVFQLVLALTISVLSARSLLWTYGALGSQVFTISSRLPIFISSILGIGILLCHVTALVFLNGAQANDWFGGRSIPWWVLSVLFFMSLLFAGAVFVGFAILLALA